MTATPPQDGTATTDNPPQDGGSPPAPTPEPDALDPAALAGALAEARREAARYRTKLRDAEGRLTEHERAGMTEAERLAAELTATTADRDRMAAELAATRARSVLTAAARAAGAVDPDLVADVLAASVDADATPDDVTATVATFLESRPYLRPAGTATPPVSAGTPPPTPGRGTAPTPDLPTFTVDQLADRPFYEANREAILAAARDGRVSP